MLTKAKWTLPLLLFSSLPVQAEKLNINQLLQNVIDHYPAIKTAYYQVASAQQENIKIQGQLGWQLGAKVGFAQEVSLFGVPVQQTSLGGSLNRKLESGDSLSLSATLAHDDADESTIPSLPNPSTFSDLRFEYTKPLGKGADNIEYKLSLINSKAGVDIKIADQQALMDKMATQIIELYLSAVNTKHRINNTKASIERTNKLVKFIKDRFKLGIVENKDQLQTDAQLQSQKAQLSALNLAWTQQTIAINRITGRNWNQPLQLTVPDFKPAKDSTVENNINLVKTYSPELRQLNSLISIAENKIQVQRQNNKDNLDLKFYIGNKTSDGDTQSGSVSDSDVIAGVQLDFKQSIDKSSDNAALFQAQLERGLQLQNKKLLLENLHFDLASLLAETKAVTQSIQAYKKSKAAEVKKLSDAEQRYKSGRIDIDQLLQFENQLSATELTLNLQKMELQQRLLKLSLLKGEIWKDIKIPVYDFAMDDFEADASVTGESL